MSLSEKWPEQFRERAAKQQKWRRVGSIIRDLITVATKVVNHGGKKSSN